MLRCSLCGQPSGPGVSPMHVPGVDCDFDAPEPGVFLTLTQLLRMHRAWEAVLLEAKDYEGSLTKEQLLGMIQNRLRGLEEIIESNGFELDHDQIKYDPLTDNSDKYRATYNREAK